MSAIKFNIGDKVVLKPNLVAATVYGGLTYLGSDMNFSGYRTICTKGGFGYYKLKEDSEKYKYTDEMLDLYQDEESCKFKAGDKVRLKDGLLYGKTYGNMPFFSWTKFHGIGVVVDVAQGIRVRVECKGVHHYYSPQMLELVKPKPKFKVGDIVCLEPNWEIDKIYNGITLRSGMVFVNIRQIDKIEEKPNGLFTYQLNDGRGFWYDEDMLLCPTAKVDLEPRDINTIDNGNSNNISKSPVHSNDDLLSIMIHKREKIKFNFS